MLNNNKYEKENQASIFNYILCNYFIVLLNWSKIYDNNIQQM